MTRTKWPCVEPGTACPKCGAILHGYPCIHHKDDCPILTAHFDEGCPSPSLHRPETAR